MSDLPRLLVIMGSGETSPTMVKAHRELLDRLGPPPTPAVVLDTPFGFQENADDIAARAVEYFSKSVGREIGLASLRRADIPTVQLETALARVRQARYVFAGPGSPSYALSVWRRTSVPDLLTDKLRSGGAVSFASAAALTLGRLTVPVYEVYKVGTDPHWLEGLDLLSEAGLPAVVIPHFNNAEGGNHDTRFCYLGERRLQVLEEQMPDDAFVLGVDEHTAAVLDLDRRTLVVSGLGVVSVRSFGATSVFPSGTTVSFDRVLETAAGAPPRSSSTPSLEVVAPEAAPVARSPLLAELARMESAFEAALVAGKATEAVAAVLDLEQMLVDWSRDTLQSDEADRGRAALRSMVVRLGEALEEASSDPREFVGPLVDTLIGLRREMREAHQWEAADALRDRLLQLGIQVHDSAAGTAWELRPR